MSFSKENIQIINIEITKHMYKMMLLFYYRHLKVLITQYSILFKLKDVGTLNLFGQVLWSHTQIK